MSQNFGELIPITQIETVPGDHIEISVANLLRCIPLVTSPFLRAKQHVDLWFVPYRDLWHSFENFITQKEQPVSSALHSAAYLPNIDIHSLYNNVKYDSSFTDIVGRDPFVTSRKLLNYLGYADYTHSPSSNPYRVNLFRLAAYNYIWYNEYRQQYYDDGLRGLTAAQTNAAILFNFDDVNCDTYANSLLTSTPGWPNRVMAMCQMRYRCWKKDLFTGLMPATQFGAVSTFGGVSQLMRSTDYEKFTVAGSSNPPTGISAGELYMSSNNSYPINNASPVVDTTIDILALRKSEALQIWRENAMRAGNRVKDNMMAHYGVASDFRDHRPTYIGSVDAPINIGDVMATANSDYSGNTNPNTNVGDIAGKGTSTLNDNLFKFDAKDFGVIMAISSILPEAEYNAYGVDRMNQLLESEDFFVPEYENLGLEAVSSLNFVGSPTNVAKVIGYAPRYFGYKTKLDKCFGSFMGNGIFAPWCSPKTDVSNALATPTVMPLSCLYVNPALYNVNFSVSISNSDQFLNDCYFDVDAVRPMSVLGLPFS